MTDFTTPQLVVTDVGLAVASQATPVGPFIHITGFRIGSAYGYNPQPTDTNINGNLLYQGVPTSYRYMGDNTLAVICEMPATVGPFEFGEVAIDLDGGVMFAKAAFATPQTKFTSLNTNVLSTYTFNCLIKLDQSVAVFQVNTLCGPPEILEVEAWTDVLPPYLGGTTSITPALIVKEQDPFGEATMIFQTSDHHWSVAGPYEPFYIGPCQPSSDLSVTIKVSDVLAYDPTLLPGEFATPQARAFVFQDNQGYMRSISGTALTVGTGEYMTLTFTAPMPYAIPTGSDVFIYTVKALSHVKLSSDTGNLIEKRDNGLYYGITAPPNLQDIFVDAINGLDSNPGTRAQPMQTIQAALALGAKGLNRNLWLYEQQTHYVDPNNRAMFRGGSWLFGPYGPLTDQLPPVPGDIQFISVAAQAVTTTVQALPMRVFNASGLMLQQADALFPTDGATVITFCIDFKCAPPATGDIINQNGTFHEPYNTGMWFLRNCVIDTVNAQSAFGSNYIVNPFQIQPQYTQIIGPGKLFSADNQSMTLNNRGGFLGSRGMTDVDLLAYIGNAAFAAPLFYNFNTNMKPGGASGSGNLTRVNVNVSNYTMPNDRIGFYQVILDEQAAGDHLNRNLYINGSWVCLLDTGNNLGFMSSIPLNPGDNVQVQGDIGTTSSTRAFVMMYPPGISSWN